MRLRVRLQSRREVVEVQNADCTIAELTQIIGAQLSLEITSFSLSLDGKTRLPSDQTTTLSDLGIVGGDLLHVILDNDSAVQSSSATTTHNASTFQSTTSSFNRTSSTGIGNDYNNHSIPSTSSTSRENQPQSENVVRPVNEASEKERQKQGKSQKSPSLLGKDAKLHAPGPSVLNDECQKQRKIEYTPNAMLCRDGTPYSLQSSYEIADVATMHEAICVAVHVLMLETGFINYRKEGDEDAISTEPSTSQGNTMIISTSNQPIISQDWKTGSGAKFKYIHPACPGLVCSVVCTSLGPYVLAHGMSNSPCCTEVHQCRLSAADFVKGNVDLKSNSAGDIYKNLQRLSMMVKDQIAYPLLSSMRHELNLEEIYGFMALPAEVKLMVLCLLPVQHILRMSATCRELHTIANDSILWQHLCFRDFGLLSKGKHTTWKLEYIQHYKDIKEREQDRERMTFVVPGMFNPPGFHNPFTPFNPPGMIGGRHDLFPNVPFMPGGINPGTLPTPGNLPRPHFDPFGPEPDMDLNPGPNRRGPGRGPGRGRGRGGFPYGPPGPFF